MLEEGGGGEQRSLIGPGGGGGGVRGRTLIAGGSRAGEETEAV